MVNYQDCVTDSVFILPRGAELGGITTWSVRMAKRLKDADEPVALIKHREMNGAKHDDISLDGLSIIKCPGKPAWSVRLNDIISYVPAYHSSLPGLLIPNWTFGTYATCALLSLTESQRMRVLGVAHSDEDIYYDWLSYYEPIIHTFVAVSDEIAANLKTLMPHRVEDILIRPCSVIDSPPTLSRSYSAAKHPIRLMYAGRIQNQQKRIYDLLILAKTMKRRHLDFQLDFFGSGSDESWLRQQFEKFLGADDSQTVTFNGNVPHADMAGYWEKADICVLVSDFEGTSISMLEAMSHGCVPVVTNVSGTKAVIQDGVNGLIVPIGDMSSMTDCIESLINDRQKLEEMGRAAYLSVADKYSFENYMTWFLTMRQAIWNKPPRQWPLGRTLLPEKFQPKPPPSLSERAMNKAKRMTDKARLSLKIRGVLGR